MMNFQYFENLLDNSREKLLYYVEQIVPSLNEQEVSKVLDDLNQNQVKRTTSSKRGNGNGEYSGLNDEQLQLIFKIFISKEISNRLSIKWLFYQFLKYNEEIQIDTIQINQYSDPKVEVDFVIKTDRQELVFVTCVDILDLDLYQLSLKRVQKFSKSQNLTPDRIIIAANKTYRNLPLDATSEIGGEGEALVPEVWLGWVSETCPFNPEDLLIVNNNNLVAAGFNFSGMADFLSYVYTNSQGGQMAIYRRPQFFAEKTSEKPKPELIWKGIMMKK